MSARLEADRNGLLTFVVNDAPVILSGSRGVQFWSKENDSGGLVPNLELTLEDPGTPVPLPPAVVWSLTGAALLSRRRRRPPI